MVTTLCRTWGLSCEGIKLSAETLYGAISTLFEKGWISALLGKRTKENAGERMLEKDKQTYE